MIVAAANYIQFSETSEHIHLQIAGEWTLEHANEIASKISSARTITPSSQQPWRVDAHALTMLDTAGALLLIRALQPSGQSLSAHRIEGMLSTHQDLLNLIATRIDAFVPYQRPHASFSKLLERSGSSIESIFYKARDLLGFIGLTLLTLGAVLLGRKKLRVTATVFHMEEAGLNAVPIVSLLSFLVGAVVAFLGATVLRDFGASIFTVELVSYSFLREFGVLLTAILLAGRSGSAFTAQIGSMKSREELDAIQALGLDAIELLVIPRLLALLTMLPILAFLGMLAGLIGGGIVGSVALDISPVMFIARMQEMTEVRHFWVGMVKAPVFAFLIAVVGCLEGFKVAGSAESVGQHTTASVVQSIFLVILFDALFAIFFMELDV